MRHLVVIVAVICAAIGDGWAQNRGNVRYAPPEDFDGDITRAPRPTPTRAAAAARRTRPTKAPEPTSVEEEPKPYQTPEVPSRTTGRRVPQRTSPQHIAPPPPQPPLLPVEDAVARYPITGEEPQAPLAKPEGRPQGARRRRPKKRRRPQNVLPKEMEEAEKQAVPVREENASILDLINEDEKRTNLFPNSPTSRNNPSTYISDPSHQPEKAAFERDSAAEQQANVAGQQYYKPQPATNRLPVGDSEPIGNSRGYFDAAAVSATEGPAPYVPERHVVPNDASYVPILNPVRVPSEGASRLQPEAYPGIQRPSLHSGPGVPLRGHGHGPSVVDPKEIIRDTHAKPVLNVIPESDLPVRSHSEVRLPENEKPVHSDYAPPSFDSAEDPLAINVKAPEENNEPSSPTNRLPNPSEIHYDSTYPEYSDYRSGFQTPTRRRQEPVEPSDHNPPLPSYANPRRTSGTKPQEYDNDAEVDRRQTSRYTPPLQRAGSKYKTENLEESTRSRTQEHSPSTSVPRTRGASRYQPPESEYTPERTRSTTSARSETPPDSPSRSRSRTSSQSTTRTRGSPIHTPEIVENTPRTNSRRQIPNTGEATRDTSSTGYTPIEETIRDQPSLSHSQRNTQPPSNAGIDSELQEYGSVRNTLRSRPQYEVREEGPVHTYEDSAEEEDVYNPLPVTRQENTRGRTHQRAAAPPVKPPEPEYYVPPNRQQSRPQYEPQQNPRSRQQPQYAAPQNPRTDSRQAASRQSLPSSRPQGRARHQSPEPAPSPRRPSGGSNFVCPDAYGFYADPVQCDKYYECRNGTAEVNLCSDGLAFKEISFQTLRCDSLRDVDCKSRPELQEPKPTKNCPRQFGLFPHETDCTKFWNCVDGVSSEVQCPPGLTYNDDKATCDWADLSESSCKTEDLIGFTCPEPTAYDLQDGVYTRYPHPDNCQLHFTCIKGADGTRRPRLLSCNEGLVYDPASSSCMRPEEVPGCEDFYGVRSPPPKRKPARQPEPEPEEIAEEAPRPRRRGSNRRTRN